MRIDRSQFGRLIQQTIKAVNSRNTIPILGHVRLIATNGTLTATATDLDLEITGSIPVEGDDCAFTVDAKMLAGIVGKLSGDTVTIEPTDNRVTVKAGRSRFTLDTLPIDDFPTMQAGEFATEFDVDLAALVAPVQFAISTEETRFYLNGVYMHVQDGKLVAVATDGHRLARHTGQDAPDFEGVILPRKLVAMLPKGTVHVSLSRTKVRIQTEETTITSCVIDGTFPDYQRVIPASNEKIVTADRALLLAATERVAVVSSERGRAVKLTAGDGKITLSVEDKAIEDVDATVSEPIEIGFNAAYLSEVLRTASGDEVRFAMEPSAPAVVTGDNESLTIVLMPMRVV